MRKTAILTMAFIVLGAAIIYIPKIETSSITDALLDFIVMGLIPGTEIFISYEAFFAGLIFTSWLIVTYNFTVACLSKISRDLSNALPTTKIEEISI